jgi:NADPH-dependent 2,4-dienoyl-CoA reductase/sulfur reductase-like enzyme
VRASVPGIEAAPASVVIQVNGKSVACRPGDTVAAALTDAGELGCRELADGSARGVFCGMGVCRDCLVTVDGIPGSRACLTPVRDGMRVDRQPALPVLQSTDSEPVLPERELAPDLLVVGGGPAGLTAAITAAEAGVDVVLVDERLKLGGQYFKQPGVPPKHLRADRLDRQFAAGRELIERASAAGVTVLTGVQVWGAFGAHEIAATGPDARWLLRPRRLVLATGAYERGVPLPGWTLPGVLSTGAAQTLLRAHQVAPGERVLVSGNGPLNMQVAAELTGGGAKVVGLAELAPVTHPSRARSLLAMAAAAPDLIRDGIGYRATLMRARVPVLNRSAVIRCEGEDRVERAIVARIDGDGHPVAGTERSFDVDAVCLGFGFLPSNELSRALGCAHDIDPVNHELVARRDHRGRTSVDDVWVVGDAGGIGGARLAQVSGVLAGADVAHRLGARPAPALSAELRRAERAVRRDGRFQAALRRLYAAPRLVDQLADDDTLICRCEGVRRAAVEAALDEDVVHIGALKRATRAGMGGCQGRYCATLLAEMATRRSGRSLDEFAWFAPTAPSKPVKVKDVR